MFYVVGKGEARQKCFDPDCKFYVGPSFEVGSCEDMEVDEFDAMLFDEIDAHPELWP